jgi:hypothetical protein
VSFKCGRGPTTTSHLDACTSMKHAHQSYAHIVLQNVTHTLVKFELKFYAQMDYTRCVISFPMAKANELNLVGIEIESPTMIGLKCLA